MMLVCVAVEQRVSFERGSCNIISTSQEHGQWKNCLMLHIGTTGALILQPPNHLPGAAEVRHGQCDREEFLLHPSVCPTTARPAISRRSLPRRREADFWGRDPCKSALEWTRRSRCASRAGSKTPDCRGTFPDTGQLPGLWIVD